MLNFKKGLALVLAAATAFTFAPVANLGVVANATDATSNLALSNATGDKISSTIYLQEGQYKQVFVNQLSALGLASVIDSVKVTSSNKDVVTVGGSNAGGSDNFSVSGSTAAAPGLNKSFYIHAEKAGDATVTIQDINTAYQAANFSQTINVHVSAVGIVQTTQTDKIEAKKTRHDSAGDYFTVIHDYDNPSTKAEDTLHPNAAEVTFKVNNYNLDIAKAYTLDYDSTNKDVVEITDVTNAKVAPTPTANLTHQVKLKIKSTGTATLNFRLYEGKNAGEKTKLVATNAVSVVVDNAIDELKVAYDGNYDNTAETASLTTASSDHETNATTPASPATPINKSQYLGNKYSETATPYPSAVSDDGKTYYTRKDRVTNTWRSWYNGSATPAKGGFDIVEKETVASTSIYLDTVKNKAIKINATDVLGRNIIFSSSANWVAVDQQGNVTINEKGLPQNWADFNNYAAITVEVPQKGTGSDTVAGLKITIPVYVSNQETSAIEVVKANGETVAKTVGSTNFNADVTKLGTVYLSTTDKSSETLKVTSNAGGAYISGQAYTGINDDKNDVNNISSDKVTYTAGTDSGTVALTKDAKNGDEAIVKLTAHKNGKNVNDSYVYFRVVVTNKKANIKVTAPSTITLTSSKKTDKINAVANSTTNLKYEFVDAIGSKTGKGTSYGDVSVDQSGNVKYTGNNNGSAVIRVSGYETTDSLEPDAAYVTVNYSSDKAASLLTVTSDKKVTLKVGDTAQIQAQGVSPAAISYKSEDADIADVDSTGKITAKGYGATIITVSTPADDEHVAGEEHVTVIVSQEGEITTKPEKVTSVKVSNKKGAYVSVKWASQGKNINYRVWKKVGNGKWVGKNVAGNKTTLSVKKGAKVQVKVKAYVKDASGKTTWGPTATKAKTFKTDKK